VDYRYLAKATSQWWESYDKAKRLVRISFSDIISEALELGEEINNDTLKLLDKDECILLPFKFVVCGTCGGSGTHVNPSIDSHGITMDEWDSEWSYDDQERYTSGFYDVQCYECNGKRVVPEIEKTRLDKRKMELVRLLEEHMQDRIDAAKERYHEVKMGY